MVNRGSGTVVPLADMFELASTLCTSAYMRDGTFLVHYYPRKLYLDRITWIFPHSVWVTYTLCLCCNPGGVCRMVGMMVSCTVGSRLVYGAHPAFGRDQG